jgi:hypothetical protein
VSTNHKRDVSGDTFLTISAEFDFQLFSLGFLFERYHSVYNKRGTICTSNSYTTAEEAVTKREQRHHMYRKQVSNIRRIIMAGVAILWALCIFVFSSIPGDSLPDFAKGPLTYIGHFCEYLILGILITTACASPNTPLWKAALIGLALAAFYGATDEFHQSFVSGRSCDIVDWLTDVAGAFVGSVGAIFVISRRKVTEGRAKDAARK